MKIVQDPYNLICVTLTSLLYKVSAIITLLQIFETSICDSLGFRNNSIVWEAFLNDVASTVV